MTPAFEAALKQIQQRQHELHTRLAAGRGVSETIAAHITEALADLSLRAEVYRFLHDRKTRPATDNDDRLLDALYVYTRRNIARETGLVLESGASLPTDPFEKARLLWFSVPHWWQSVSGDTSSDLFTPHLPKGTVWSERVAGERVCLEPGTFVQREEQFWRSTRFQLFRATGDAHSEESFLRLVLRQWVEEEEVDLSGALHKNKHWERLVASPHAFLNEGSPDDATMHVLLHAGLPCTPSVQRYLKYEISKRHAPDACEMSFPDTLPILPYRGGMLTTFVLSSRYESEPQIRIVTNLVPGEWATYRFYELAHKAVKAHEKWVREQAFGDLSLPALQGVPPKDDALNRDIDNDLPRDVVVANALHRLEIERERPLTVYEKEAETRRAKERCRYRKNSRKKPQN